jgi:hypothetical protein
LTITLKIICYAFLEKKMAADDQAFRQYDRMSRTFYNPDGSSGSGGGSLPAMPTPSPIPHPGEMAKDQSDIELTFVGQCRKTDDKKQSERGGGGCGGDEYDELEDSGPIVPSEPTEVDWSAIFAPYEQEKPWGVLSKFLLINKVEDKDAMTELRKGSKLYSIMSVEATMRPIAVELIEFQQGRAKTRPMWQPLHEARLRTSAVFMSAAKAFTKNTAPNPGLSFLVKMFHVNWRFYLFVIIHVQDESDKVGFGRPFLGYHYYAIDKKTAIIKKCF